MNSSPIKLDQTDKKILNILQKQAKITNAQLSKDIDLSPAPTLERVKKLENSGIIVSYHAKLNTQLLGLNVAGFVQVRLAKFNSKSVATFLEKIEEVDDVVECHAVSGEYNYLLKIVAKDLPSYEAAVREKVGAIDEVGDVASMMILSTGKDHKVIPVP